MTQPLLTADQAAAFLGMHPETVYKLAHRGDLPHLRFGNTLRFVEADLLEYGRQNAQRAAS